MSSRYEPINWTQFQQLAFTKETSQKYSVFLVLLLSLSQFTTNSPIILKQSIDLFYKLTDFSMMGTNHS